MILLPLMAERSKTLLRKLARHSTRLIVAMALLLAIFVVLLWFRPFSWNYVNEKIQRAFLDSTGFELEFKELVFHLAQKQITLRDAKVIDPKSSEVLAGAAQISAELQVSWMSREVKGVDFIRIDDPLPLVLIKTDDGIDLSPGIAELLTAQRSGSSAGPARSFIIDRLTLTNASIQLHDPASQKSHALVTQARIIGSWSGLNDFEFLADGMFTPEGVDTPGKWRGKISHHPDRQGITFFTQIANLNGKSDWIANLPLFVSGKGVSLAGRFYLPEGEQYRANVQLAAESLLVENRLSGGKLSASNLHLKTDGKFNKDTSQLRLSSTELEALGVQAKGDLTVEFRAPYPYSLVLSRLHLPQESIRRLQDFQPELRKVIDYHDGHMVLSGIAAGTLADPVPDLLEGTLALSDVELGVPSLPFPLRNLNGSAYFDGTTLEWQRVSGNFGKSRLELSGNLLSTQVGGLLAKQPGELQMRWALDGQSEDLLSLVTHTNPEAIKGLATSGAVVSSGTLTTKFGSPPSLKNAADNLQMQGVGFLEDFSLNHPSLPSPIRSVSGTLNVHNERLTFDNVEGQFLSSSAKFNGSISGQPYFWQNPDADLRIETDLDLARLADELRPRLQESLTLPPVKGDAMAEIRLVGRLDQLDSLRYTGNIDLKNVETQVDAPAVHGTLRNISGRLTLEKERVIFENLKLSIQDVRYELSGEIGPAEMKAQIAFRGPLEQIKQAQHPLYKMFEVGGSVECTDKVHLVLPEPERNKALADRRFPVVLAFIDGIKSVRARSIDTTNTLGKLMKDQDGKWIFRDATFSHVAFPAKMHRMNGTITLFPGGIRSSNLNLYIGNDPARVGLEILFNSDGHKLMKYDIKADRADLTPWYGKWRTVPDKLKSPPAPPSPNPVLKSVTLVNLQTGVTKIKDYNFTRHTGNLRYENWRGGNKILKLNEITGEGYGGRVRADGRLTFVRNAPVAWNMQFQIWKADVKRFLSRNGKPAFLSGSMDVTANLKGSGASKEKITGSGSFQIDRPQFEQGNPVVMQFIQMVKIFQLSDMVFADARGKFDVRDGYVRSDRVTMGNEVMELAARGRVGLNRYLDFEVYIKPLSAVRRIPLLNQPVEKLIDVVSSSLLKFRIRGPAGSPDILPIPASADRIEDLRGLFTR